MTIKEQRDAVRCFGTGSSIYEVYHDDEWGVPTHDDRELFELLILEGAQAGLSWETILKRRETYRAAYDNFDINKVANYGPIKIQALLEDEGIIRKEPEGAPAGVKEHGSDTGHNDQCDSLRPGQHMSHPI